MMHRRSERNYHRPMRMQRPVLAVVLAMLVAAPTAAAKNYAPPGKAGSSQYAEVIPSSGGNVSTPALGGGNPTAAQISKLGAGMKGVHRLTRLGSEGAAAAKFAQATAPGTTAPSTPGRPRPVVLTAPQGSVWSGLGRLLGGSDAGGIGIFLPLLLAFGLGAAVAFTAQRARRGRRPPV